MGVNQARCRSAGTSPRRAGAPAAYDSPEAWDAACLPFVADPNRVWRVHADAVNRNLIAEWLGPVRGAVLKTDLFDEAQGAGQAETLRRYSDEVVGLDLSPRVTSAAAARHPRLDCICGDVRSMPFPDGSFSAIVSLSTLDHFAEEDDIATALAELHRILTPGGRLVVTFDNPANPILALRGRLPFPALKRLGLMPYWCGPTLGRRGLGRALRDAGFEVRAEAAVLHCPRVLAIPACRIAQRWGWPGIGSALALFEGLGRTPLAYATGHFVAALAVRPDGQAGMAAAK